MRGFAKVARPYAYLFWRVIRGKVLGVRAIAKDSEGRVLLVEHSYRAGWWLPGGGVEATETLQQAVCRELREEAGATVLGAPRLASMHHHRERRADDHIALFTASIGQAAPRRSFEVRRVGLFLPAELPWEDIDPGCARRLREHFTDDPPADLW